MFSSKNTAALAVLVVIALVAPLAAVASNHQPCIQVITYAENPGTGECVAFPTPCDVPKGWKSCEPQTEPMSHQPCIQVITYAQNPGTGECVAFPTPCDVPKGWQSCTQ